LIKRLEETLALLKMHVRDTSVLPPTVQGLILCVERILSEEKEKENE